MTIIVLILFIPQIGLALIAPSLLYISKETNVSMSIIMASYMVGMGAGQIVWGTLSDLLGRKWLMLIGVFSFAISSILITLFTHPSTIILLRIIQGFSTGSMFPITTAMMCDLYKQGPKLVLSIVIAEIGFGIAWTMLPLIGSFIEHLTSWKANFYAMSAYVFIVALLSWKYLSETHTISYKIYNKDTIKLFLKMFANPLYIYLPLMVILPNTFFLVFNSNAPALAKVTLHQPDIIIGLMISTIGAGYSLMIIANIFIFHKFNSLKILKVLIILSVLISMLQFTFATINFLNLYTLYLPIIATVSCWAILFPHITAMAMEQYPNHAGTCASNFGFIFYTGAGICTYLFAFFFDKSFFDITLYTLLCSVAALILLLLVNLSLRKTYYEK